MSKWFSEVSAYHEYASCWVAADEEAVDEHNTFWEDCDGELVFWTVHGIKNLLAMPTKRRGISFKSSSFFGPAAKARADSI